MNTETLLHMFNEPNSFQAKQPVHAGFLHMCLAADIVFFHSHPVFEVDKLPEEC